MVAWALGTHYGGRPLGVHNLMVIGCAGLVTICQRHSIDCLRSIGLVLVDVAVTAKSLLVGSKADPVANQGLVPVNKPEYTICLSGFVPCWS